MNIALAYNVRHTKPDINNPQYIVEAEFDEPATIMAIKKALKKLGHRVFTVEADEGAYVKFQKLKRRIDLVFNIAEGINGRDREAQIPAMLEMLGLPYTGPGPLSYALGLDKIRAKEIMSIHHIPTPAWIAVEKISDLCEKNMFAYPVIAKPMAEGSSKGIRAKNLAHNFKELKKITHDLLQQFKQRVLIEEFLGGREFTVAVIGNPARVLPIIELTFDKLPIGMPHFDHYEAKWIYDNPDSGHDPLICPAKTNIKLAHQIEDISLKAFQALGMADWARIDIRLDITGKPHIIEVNCPPGIIPDPKENSRFPRAAHVAGLSYNQMIEKIIISACQRCKVKYFKKIN